MPIEHAKVSFKPNGTPVADAFDDVYFNDGDGLRETDYVFIEHNQLPQRWQEHTQFLFVIAETGFGSGLNCLRAMQHFAEFRNNHPDSPCRHLHLISTEKYPLQLADLQTALTQYPSLESVAQQLIAQYPAAIEGCHRLEFILDAARISLDLWFGDILTTLPSMPMETDGLVDAWFLDGFAPSKNPDMWQPTLFQAMARLSRCNATVATFTASGIVKRGLMDAGFTIKKVKGFGRKRDMLTATLDKKPEQTTTNRAPYYARQPVPTKPHIIRIIGGGIASGTLALQAVRMGLSVEVYCRDDELAQGASGNHSGGLYPQLTSDISIASLIQAHCFGYAMRFYNTLHTTQDFGYEQCGVLLLAHSDAVKQRQLQLQQKGLWPSELVKGVDATLASELAGVTINHDGLFIPQGGWVDPPSLVHALIEQAKREGECAVQTQTHIDNDTLKAWQAEEIPLVLAMGHHSPQLQELAPLPYRLVKGQIEHVPANDSSQALGTVICHKGYFTPAYKGYHALGSTYDKTNIDLEYHKEDSQKNWQTHDKAMAGHTWYDTLSRDSHGRAAVRCSTPDHQPLLGALPDIHKQKDLYQDLYKALPLPHYGIAANYNNLYLFTGLGSRGLTTAPLLSAVLLAHIIGGPLPMSQTLLDALQPNRFLMRSLIRQAQYDI
ncbi:bifunctional tRNA (5-methylaminomethyl-2-thiouridine)(34)-methyltransferase MnmD/FAD-dependent 5-carboxymethylaminomethyl-2-thiouridine(34) oxidoreductase MnmC [Alteromonas sp. LMIT006]|uniref:bifunctional tRNA (5-methylaminomethyl-2-thiouridine)(34)-methyltransferase MnmD/FAD-dependent 5-carboxymethylaminomethyl-2-thiouridine(34) oxidoreductase MnmC n=1 Tax=Alteromonadaceae TaxID=72275 RepID=UPI0020CA6C53|nr:bifunctional tRNA (5-methylaminomethyl-2-thiouridine)(34)-methyltransferase MnmD/FAD-dependent 5-carboxymethylaminomethyl-2-thiouridine(34) oxidoreductase MnmC [Alteromonas sp. LMIT006]UTP72513.1 bifunctional tRNA (5-methylaminomethyl-2-thiouridine)(34)-methyltransferase MnmD/FAD-dependent 5-carboxymethylaminomethyl-2-thiouridine(34) oxidoreductase MnmC [Alteromonas sp. LMIT006]